MSTETWGLSAGRDNAWQVDEEILSLNQLNLDSPWAQTLPPDQIAIAEALPLRRDMLTFLTYLRDYHPVGTQSTGNLSLLFERRRLQLSLRASRAGQPACAAHW